MEKIPVIIFGNNQTACLAKFYLNYDSNYNPVAFCVDKKFNNKKELDGLPVVDFEKIKEKYDNKNYKFFVPIYDNILREKKYIQVKEKGYEVISYLSSKCICHGIFGENCFIMENNTIQPFVKIGNNVIIWSGNHIGHHSEIDNNVFISSHVVISGNCKIKSYSWLGVNSCIRDNIVISEGSFICMGSNVINDTKPWNKYFGNPAKIKCGKN